jgi:hypothetical protein
MSTTMPTTLRDVREPGDGFGVARRERVGERSDAQTLRALRATQSWATARSCPPIGCSTGWSRVPARSRRSS